MNPEDRRAELSRLRDDVAAHLKQLLSCGERLKRAYEIQCSRERILKEQLDRLDAALQSFAQLNDDLVEGVTVEEPIPF